VCTGCGWVLDATMALVDEGEKQTLTSGALVSQSTGTFVSVRDNGEGHLIYGGGIHSQIMSSAIRAKGRHVRPPLPPLPHLHAIEACACGRAYACAHTLACAHTP
jgi:hypothetical protein